MENLSERNIRFLLRTPATTSAPEQPAKASLVWKDIISRVDLIVPWNLIAQVGEPFAHSFTAGAAGATQEPPRGRSTPITCGAARAAIFGRACDSTGSYCYSGPAHSAP